MKVKSDPLILALGQRKFDKTGQYPHTHQYIAQKLRELARFVIALQKIDSSIKTLSDCFSAKHWETVISAVKDLALFDNASKFFSKPTLAKKIGHSLKNCAKMFGNNALKTGDRALKERADGFIELYEEEWKDRITSQALESLEQAKYNRVRYLPLVEDVVKLSKFIDNQIEDICKEKIGNKEHFSRLACLCLTQIIVFNRKRSGEVERLKKVSVSNAMKQPSLVDEDVKKCLSRFEQKLCENHCRIETRGKKGRRVAILLTRKMKQNLGILMAMHAELELDTEYIFQKPNTSFPIRGTRALRQLADEADLKHADRITSTTLRKQLATMSQVLDLSESSQDILAQFMGQDIRIHRDFYRLPQSTLEIAKVSKVLHAMNTDMIETVAGKDLDDIDAMDHLEIEQESDTEDGTDDIDDGATCTNIRSCPKKKCGHQPDDDAADDDDDDNGSETDDEGSENEEYLPPTKKKKFGLKNQNKQMGKKTPWSWNERQVVEKEMKLFFDLQKLPGKHDCQELIKKHDVLKRRSWTMVKGYVRNRIISINRQLKQ
ncbi:uncharacterized protein LOC123523522 [Mercenaria mercenaria]|uniref:uncharacterized protein LOC123523522 n=1 Tax=Mercenaria mercenaria TaxID=6596 RepID=UPI001E1DF31D|nr:uncharacterized protein LOC123523522 [Mercenaria mercenaria]